MAKNKRKKQTHTHEINAAQVQNPILKKALENLKRERTSENEQTMLKALIAADLVIPVQMQGTGQNARIQFIFVHANEKHTFLPVFTDVTEAEKLKMPQTTSREYVVRHLTDLATLFKEPSGKAEGIVIDPFGINIIFPAKVILALANTKTASPSASKQNTVLSSAAQFTEPRVYPTAMINAVHDAARNIPEIQQIFFKQMIIPGTMTGFALFVKTAAGSVGTETAQALKEVAAPLAKSLPVEILSWSEKIGDTVLKDAVALYDAEFDI